MEIITKQKAKEDGLLRYYTGKPCKKGHLSERYTNGGGCIDCLNENTAKRIKDIYSNPEKLAAFRKQCNDKRIRLMKNPEYRERQYSFRKMKYKNDREYRESLKQNMKKWNAKNKHNRRDVRKRWAENNIEKVREASRIWRRKNPGKSSMYTRLWRHQRRRAMPDWVQKKHIQDMYDSVAILNKACGCIVPGKTAYHVDHIIPLNHSDVCGLHVPWNLQILPAQENLRKSNKLELR